MAMRLAHRSSTTPFGVWVSLAVLSVGLAVSWAIPETRLLVGTGLAITAIIATVLVALRRRSAPGGQDETPAAPLHLRD